MGVGGTLTRDTMAVSDAVFVRNRKPVTMGDYVSNRKSDIM